MHILITGARGFIGQALKPHLERQGHAVKTLSRQGDYTWGRLGQIPWEDFDAVIHLAGENIFGRWSASKKKRLMDSRVVLTESIAHNLARTKKRPKVFICASGIGIYGDTGKQVVDEQACFGETFLAQLAAQWENACTAAKNAGVRTVPIRMGTVLSQKGGALQKMLPLFKLGLGGTLGTGDQLQSFVALED
ncbi:MAG TPA: NAD-dependent epimerase/dehydratase family protein, partial [Opitutales bacterium]|nr:NAD-dependent epimerase/dehydratase family protein [Opitutales bacterium]